MRRVLLPLLLVLALLAVVLNALFNASGLRDPYEND